MRNCIYIYPNVVYTTAISCVPEYITKKSGVFFKVEQTVKFSSIQYLNIITSPFSKITGLNFIILNVYGGKMLLLFLRHSDSREILKYIGDDYC